MDIFESTMYLEKIRRSMIYKRGQLCFMFVQINWSSNQSKKERYRYKRNLYPNKHPWRSVLSIYIYLVTDQVLLEQWSRRSVDVVHDT